MRIFMTEFRQESNSFSPVRSTLEQWRQGGILDPEQVHESLAGKPCAIGGMIQALEDHAADAEVVHGTVMFSQSGGIAEQAVMDHYLERLIPQIEACLPLDGVLLSFHGALQTTEFDDPEAEITRRVREIVGDRCVIATSTDLHGYISQDLVRDADLIVGYQTYPHVDFFETGYRTAKLALEAITGGTLEMAWVPIPMIVSASAYNTLEGPFRDLIEHGRAMVDEGRIIDFTVYQMQPWLDLAEGNSSAVVIAADRESAAAGARELAQRLYAARHEFTPNLMSIDEIIDLAEDPDTPKPVILVDSADSCNAGAPGDSMAVAARLLERGSQIRAATVVNDPAAAAEAHRIGIGGRATFEVGRAHDPNAVSIKAEGYVRSVHDGEFAQEGPAGRGMINRIGTTAVLRFGTLDTVVCEWMAGNGDPQLYRAFGIEPTLYDLVVVKANTSFRAAYTKFAGLICEADTPGSAAADLSRLDFRRLPKSMYPWTDTDEIEYPVHFGRDRSTTGRRA